MSAEPRALSSGQTFVMKVLFPIVWIGIFALVTLSMFVSPDSWKGRDGQAPVTEVRWIFAFTTLVGTVFIWWSCLRLKRVRMDEQALYVSNYLTEMVVPLANVAEVSENRWVNNHPVTVRFHSDTEFGSTVTFIPKMRWRLVWSPHPVVEEIQQAVRRSTGQEPG